MKNKGYIFIVIGLLSLVVVLMLVLFLSSARISLNSVDPYEWLDKVVQVKNPNLCKDTPNYSAGEDVGYYSKSESIRMCKALYGGRILDINYCLGLNRSSQNGINDYLMCLKEFSRSAKTAQQCEELPTVVSESNYNYQIRESCYYTVAKVTNNPEICKKITSSFQSQNDCLNNLHLEYKQEKPGDIDREKCIDSIKQCYGKPDGTVCNYGVWCDEEGRVCGGQSCVGLLLGKCIRDRCELEK